MDTSKPNLKLYFCDFWPDFQAANNYFYHLLSTRYNVTIDSDDPDLLFFSVDLIYLIFNFPDFILIDIILILFDS